MKKVNILTLLLLLMSSSEAVLLSMDDITAPVVEAAPVVAQQCISRQASNMLISLASGMGGGVLVGCVIWAITSIVQGAQGNATLAL